MKKLKSLKRLEKARRYKYSVLDISKDQEIGFRAVIAAFPKLYILADSVDELHQVVLIAIAEEIEHREKNNHRIPKPDNLENEYSGKFLLRVRPEIHQMLIELSDANNRSLNQFVTEIIEDRIR